MSAAPPHPRSRVSRRRPSALRLAALAAVFLGAAPAAGLGRAPVVTFAPGPVDLVLADGAGARPLLVDSGDHAGVLRAVDDLAADFERVTGRRPDRITDLQQAGGGPAVLIGTLGRSALIEDLVAAGKIDGDAIDGAWEAFLVQTVAEPFPGLHEALVIAGSDRRGTIYGIYELSEQIGVSPWYWWADVPVTRREVVAVRAGSRLTDRPAVRYRGIFLNDEAPALAGWVGERFGSFDHRFYGHVFELILRLRGNLLWPAMWGRAFADDDPESPSLADHYGVVIGTSHHEPMHRAHVEWSRYGRGPWDYTANAGELRRFWTGGVERSRPFETIATLGMRGDGDEPMSEEENVELLERIVADQREILAAVHRRPLEEIEQVWTLYKEVQGYYERGMRVPDDVTLLWSDDNWGNLRRLPTPAERNRSGGSGVYYHLDYVGGPRSYKWLNITPISKIWQQMSLAWHYGARRLWIVNVGDLKPMEFPIEFFLNLAWSPESWPHSRLAEYGSLWAEREFGPRHAAEIASMIATYTRFNRRRSPELLSPETYSLVNYREAERVVAEYGDMAARAAELLSRMPESHRDAFFQLVYWPIAACANLNDLYVSTGRNRLHALQGRTSTNPLADRARHLFAADAELTRRYNRELSGGKWNHFADQAHIGYTYWQQPPRQVMPPVSRIHPSRQGAMAVAVEGDRRAWGPGDDGPGILELPPLDPFAAAGRWIEVFNRGLEPFSFTTAPSDPWLRVEPAAGVVDLETRLTVTVDWERAPHGRSDPSIEIRDGEGREVRIQVPVFFPPSPERSQIDGFVETDGHVSIEAEHWGRAVDSDGVGWRVIPGFGRTLSGVTILPVTAGSRAPGDAAPRLEYPMHLFTTGEARVHLYTAPAIASLPGRELRLALAFDDDPPRIVQVHAAPEEPERWERMVSDSVLITSTEHQIAEPGRHVLKVWMVDPGVVLEKIVVDLGGLRKSYLGPPETFRRVAPRTEPEGESRWPR